MFHPSFLAPSAANAKLEHSRSCREQIVRFSSTNELLWLNEGPGIGEDAVRRSRSTWGQPYRMDSRRPLCMGQYDELTTKANERISAAGDIVAGNTETAGTG